MILLMDIIIPIVCGTIISIIFFLYSKRERRKAIVLAILTVFCAISILIVMHLNSEVYSNDYVKLKYKGLELNDKSNLQYPCNIHISDGENSIRIFTSNVSVDTYNSILSNEEYYLGVLNGYCDGYAMSDSKDSEGAVVRTNDRGVLIGETFVNYPNTSVCDNVIDGRQYLNIIKILYVRNGEMLIAVLTYKDINYAFFCNSTNENVVKFRECFDSITQNVVNEEAK